MAQENPNLRIFNQSRSVPEIAKKTIKAGKLKGMTNISPMYRIEKLTELFGPCGVGWKIINCKYWTSEGVGECVVSCSLDILIFQDGQWSEPINGVGGSKLYGKGVGDGINDEAFKMAQTDAISVACKNLGIGADVYYGLDDTKYREEGQYGWGAAPQPGQAPVQSPFPPQAGYAPQQPVQAPPQPQSPQRQPAGVQITLEQAIDFAVKASTTEKVVAVWNTYKGLYGAVPAFKKAIKDNPHNPGRQ